MAFFYDHVIIIRILPLFFLTDAQKHQAKALTSINPDGYIKYSTYKGKLLMSHSLYICHVCNLIIKHSCMFYQYSDDEMRNVKMILTELRK